MSWLREAVFLTLATVALYSYTYCFEVGYAFEFGYPIELVKVNIDSILNVWILLLVYLFLLVGFLQLNFYYWPYRWRNRLIVVLVIYFAIVVWLRSQFGFNGAVWAMILPSVAAFGVLYWKKKNPPREPEPSGDSTKSVPMMYDARSEVQTDSIARHLVQRLGYDPLLLVVLIFLAVPGLFIAAGWADATSRSAHHYFADPSTQKEYVILRIFGATTVSAMYDPKEGSCQRQYLVRSVEELGLLQPAQGSLEGCNH